MSLKRPPIRQYVHFQIAEPLSRGINKQSKPSNPEANQVRVSWSHNRNGPHRGITKPFTAFNSASCPLRISFPRNMSSSQSAAWVSIALLLNPPPLKPGTSEHSSSNPCLMRFRRFCSDKIWLVRFCSSVRFSRAGLVLGNLDFRDASLEVLLPLLKLPFGRLDLGFEESASESSSSSSSLISVLCLFFGCPSSILSL